MRILTVTTNFGFGPSSKLYSIIKELLKMGYKEITFCGNGESINFFKTNFGNRLEYIECDTDEIRSESFLKIVDIKNYELLINVMNLNIPKIQRDTNLNVKSVFVDSLSWMWENPLDGINEYDIYFVQNAFIDPNNLSQYKNIQTINPIINTEGITKTKDFKNNKILLNFAGIVTPYENDVFFKKYMLFYLKLFSKIPNIDKYEIDCACNMTQKKWIESNNRFDYNVTFKVMSHKEFLSASCEASRIFTTPGLTFYLESLELGLKPHYFLPSNYSQALLLEKYNQISGNCNTLSKYGYLFSTDELLEESEGVTKVREAFSNISTRYKEEIFDNIISYINEGSVYESKNEIQYKEESGIRSIIRIMLEKGLLKGR
ncbi:hypothetical protein [Streptococcus sp. 2154]|uniref:hypothetical protein n=1 Tax=Streptococcus sp. 2154 TaxID=2582650 RepID=UPI001562990B|nr:hypothetical protein [Streptococcus sp. 2154]